MAKHVCITDEKYVKIGKTYGSDLVAEESSEATARWERDIKALGPYGHGSEELNAFKGLTVEHGNLRVSRPEVIAQKKNTLGTRDKDIEAGWAWVDKVTSNLGRLAKGDEALANQVNEATPADDAALGAGIGSLATILERVKGSLPEDSQAQKRLDEAPGLQANLDVAPGLAHTAKASTVADTREIDLLDGKIYITIRDLNKAARKAIRNGELNAKLDDYKFHKLARKSKPKAEEKAPTELVKPPQKEPAPA